MQEIDRLRQEKKSVTASLTAQLDALHDEVDRYENGHRC